MTIQKRCFLIQLYGVPAQKNLLRKQDNFLTVLQLVILSGVAAEFEQGIFFLQFRDFRGSH